MPSKTPIIFIVILLVTIPGRNAYASAQKDPDQVGSDVVEKAIADCTQRIEDLKAREIKDPLPPRVRGAALRELREEHKRKVSFFQQSIADLDDWLHRDSQKITKDPSRENIINFTGSCIRSTDTIRDFSYWVEGVEPTGGFSILDPDKFFPVWMKGPPKKSGGR